MKRPLLLAALFMVLGASAEAFPRVLKLDAAANAEMEKFIGTYSVENFEARENGLPVEAKSFKLVKIALAKSRNPTLPTEGSYDLDLYVAPETHTRWEMWNHDATFGGEEGIERDGVVMRLELIKRFPAWKKISYSVVGDEQIIMTDVFSFEQTINALVFRQTRSLLNFKRGEVGKKPSSKVKNSEYIYTLKKL